MQSSLKHFSFDVEIFFKRKFSLTNIVKKALQFKNTFPNVKPSKN